MAKITVDGIEYEVNPENNLLQESLSHGLDLPYFCWHPCMGSVGACRQCAVKQYRDADDKNGTLVMACMTPASDGAIISIEDEQARGMREKVIESLMISHPHDCPVCEEGGECHLQDMTLMSGHNYRRYDKKKVTHRNQYLGPFINHEMNRCITCYRCVRFYEYAGGKDLAAQASHHHTYFGRHQDGVLESEFSGNLVEVCPTGVFTDKAFSAQYARKWDLQTAPSVCVGCSVGCNITPGERYGTLRRVVNRYNSEINGYFICDRGRFGFDYVNSEDRLETPSIKKGSKMEAVMGKDLQEAMQGYSGQEVIGIGSPRATNEANYALRSFVGKENFYSGMADNESEASRLILDLLKDEAFHAPSIKEIEKADAVIVLGEDLTNTAARVALALRQSVRNKAKELAESINIPVWQDAAVKELAQHERSPLILLSNYATRLDDVASDSIIDSSEVLSQIGYAIAGEISGSRVTCPFDETSIALIAEKLTGAKNPLVIAGSSADDIDLIQSAANIARALSERRGKRTNLCLTLPEVNSVGMTMMVDSGNTLGAALSKLESGEAKKVIILENDLFRRAPLQRLDSALDKCEGSLVIDQISTQTTKKATMVLPSTAFSEHEGTYVNYEGRAQLSFQVHQNKGAALPAWKWLRQEQKETAEDITRLCARDIEGFAGLDDLLPRLSHLVPGIKVPRQSHRHSGRTAMRANLNVHEPKQPMDEESVMSFSMEGVPLPKDATVLGAPWAPAWNSNQSISKFQEEINGSLKQGHTGKLILERNHSGGYLVPRKSELQSLPGLKLMIAYQIFGSEELSAKSVNIQNRMTDSYVAIAPEDAETLSLDQGDRVSLGDTSNTAIACIRTKIKTGTAAVYFGDNELDRYSLPQTLVLSKAEGAVAGNGLNGLIVSDLLEESY